MHAISMLLLVAAIFGLVITVIMVVGALRYNHARSWRTAAHEGLAPMPTVSVLVPAFNEESTLGNNLEGLVRQDHPSFEIVVIDDGSTDGTAEVAERYADIYPGLIRVLRQSNTGKAMAMNNGLMHATGEVVVVVDADSSLAHDALSHIAGTFADPEVQAVGGNVRIANRSGGVAWLQASEYVFGLAVQRSAFAQANAIQVLAGALSGFRAETLRNIGGYSSDTLVEDMDVTLEIASLPGRLVYNPEAIAYTEGPRSWQDLLRQRYRWTYGGFQALSKHRSKVMNPKSGTLGLLGLPFFLLGPWLVVLGTLGVAFLAVSAIVGAIPPAAFLLSMAFALLVQGSLVTLAVALDGEDPRLIIPGTLMPVLMAPPLALTTLRSAYSFVFRKEVKWTKLKRLGANVLPASATGASGASQKHDPAASVQGTDGDLVTAGGVVESTD